MDQPVGALMTIIPVQFYDAPPFEAVLTLWVALKMVLTRRSGCRKFQGFCPRFIKRFPQFC